MQYQKCPICSSSIKTWKKKIVDKINFNIDLCGSCGYAFVNPRPSIDFLMNYYSSSLAKEGSVYLRNEHFNLQSILSEEKACPNSTIDAKNIINEIKSLIQKKTISKFLDIGCGCGFFFKRSIKQRL